VKPVVLGAGTCIVGVLLDALHDICGSESRFDFIKCLAEPGGRKPVPADVLARCRLVVEEALPWDDYRTLSDDEHSKLPGDCTVLRVPAMHFNSLWPLMVSDPRNTPQPGAP
jgi:hypothetical protein